MINSTLRILLLVSVVIASCIVTNAQKSIQNYVTSNNNEINDEVIQVAIPQPTESPYVIISDDDTQPYNPPATGPIEMSFGEIPYSIETNSNGQIHINVPISSYATEFEFAPHISLDYNSGRNSFDCLGKGWTIKGIPIISRVTKDFFTDGNIEGIQLNDNYTFALNGERLIYQEEVVDTIKFIGQVSNTQAHFVENHSFIVMYPDGGRATLNTTDGINFRATSVSQKDGQNIACVYGDPCASGNDAEYITSISYGDGKRMVFNYEVSPDSINHYCAGRLYKKRTRLKDIVVLNASNDTITRYHMWSAGKIDSPINEINQYFKGGKMRFPLEFYYCNQHELTFGDTIIYNAADCPMSMKLNPTKPNECVLQRGKFMHDSEGEGFLMYKNNDSYYYKNGKYESRYSPLDKVLVALKSNMSSNAIPCTTINMDSGFVDAFVIDADGIHGEEIVKINNWKLENGLEQMRIAIYKADNDTTTLQQCINANDPELSSSDPLQPKTFLTGDFDGDGKNELLYITYDSPEAQTNTNFRLLSLEDGSQKLRGTFGKCLKVYFPTNEFENFPWRDTLIRRISYKNSNRVFPIDYNGDGKMEIGIIDEAGFSVYEFRNNILGSLSLSNVCNLSFPSLSDLRDYGMKIGEFNGDGIADLLFYIEPFSTETTLDVNEHKLFKFYLGKGDGTFALKSHMSLTNNLVPEDILLHSNRNGITDIVIKNKTHYNYNLTCLNIRNGRIFYSNSYMLPENSSLVQAYVYGECGEGSIIAVQDNYVVRKYTLPYLHDENWKISRVRDSYHNTYKISYRRVYENNLYHPNFSKYSFPYTIRANGQLVCHSLQKYDTGNNLVSSKCFDYGNLVFHQQGLGQLGFDSIYVHDNVSNRWISTVYDPLKLGATIGIDDCRKTCNKTFSLDVSPHRRIRLLQTMSETLDKATGLTSSTCYTHDQYGNVTSSHTINQDGTQSVVSTNYINSTSNGYIIGLPQRVEEVVTNANGNIVTGNIYTYNDRFQPISMKHYYGDESKVLKEASHTYDNNNRVATSSSRRFQSQWLTNTFSYEGDSRKPLTMVDSCGWTHEYWYCKFGIDLSCISRISIADQPISPMDAILAEGDGINETGDLTRPGTVDEHIPIGLVTDYAYDEAGNVTRITNPDGTKHLLNRTWIYNHIDVGGKFFVTDSVTGKPVTRTYYNSLGLKTRVETQRPDGTFLKVDYEYDALGRLVKQYEPYKDDKTLFTSFEYDDFDRPVCKTYPDGHSDTFSYNGLTTTSFVGGIVLSRTVDALGNLVAVTDDGGTINYSTTPDGRPLSVTVNGEVETTFEYDTYGRRTAINDPSAGRTSYTYDAAGNVATVTDARGKVTATTYNNYGLPTSATIGSDMTVTYFYNNYLMPTAINCSNGNSKQFTYNKYHQLTSETINGFKKSYSYSGGNVASVNYKLNGENLGTETYQRTRGTLTGITFRGKSLWQLCAEDDRGLPTSLSSGVGTASLEYDDMKRITRRIAETNSYGTIHDMQYEYDDYGNMTYREDGNWGNDEDFEYDNLNRLISTPAGDVTYDGKGNITAHDAAGVFSYGSSKPYALSQISLSGSAFPTTEQHITFNAMNRPDTISEGSVSARFKYFEDGERSQMIVSGNNFHNVHKYFGSQFTTLDLNEQGYEGQKQILFLGGDAYTAPAALVREKLSGSSTWSQSLYYIVRDNLGSITQVVDSTGMIAQELSYDAWGRLRDHEMLQLYAPSLQPELLLNRGYCGHEHLSKFNLINMNARLYDPWTARFLSPDPYVQLPDFTQSFNRYSYCLNNPLKLVDPEGENPVYYLNGKFIGLTKEGFTGEIIICTVLGKYKFSDYTANELLNEKDVYTMDDCMRNDIGDSNHLSGFAMSNIWTNVADYFVGRPIVLNGNSTDVFFSLDNILFKRILYSSNLPKETYFLSTYGYALNYIEGSGYNNDSYESTVENIANVIIYHEWYSHIMCRYGNHNYMHHMAYLNEILSPFWKDTTFKYQMFTLNNYLGLLNYEIRHLHK